MEALEAQLKGIQPVISKYYKESLRIDPSIC